MHSIKDLLTKINSFKKVLFHPDIFIILLIILVAFISFGLGKLSQIQQDREPLKITKDDNLSSIINTDKRFAASKNGSKYYSPWCGGINRIKEENKIWFKSEKEAENRGYTPAKNC